MADPDLPVIPSRRDVRGMTQRLAELRHSDQLAVTFQRAAYLPGPGPATPADGRSVELAVMRARLAAMAQPRADDDAEVAALRAVLRDQRFRAQVMATVEQWPPLTEDQLAALAALLTTRPRPRPG